MSLDMTAAGAMLKTRYTSQAIEDLTYQKNPALALIPKDESDGGDSFVVPVIVGDPQNTSADFATAMAGTSVGNYKKFIMTRVTEYNKAVIDNQTILASKGDAVAFYKVLKLEMDRAIHAVSRQIAQAMYRSGWGDLGTILAVSGSTFTLTNPSDGCNFEIGKRIVFSSSLNAATLRSGTAIKVTGVARGLTTTTITCDTALATPGGVAGDTVFDLGSRDNSATPTARRCFGFESWVPSSIPTSGATFCNVDRFLDSRLYGQIISGTSKPLEETLIDAAALVAREGGELSHFMCNPGTYANLQKALGSKVVIDVGTTNPNVGFKGLQVYGPTGPIAIVADQNCPQNRVFGLEMSSWMLRSLGGVPQIIDTDGNVILRTGALEDSVTVQVGAYYQVNTSAPSHNVNIAL